MVLIDEYYNKLDAAVVGDVENRKKDALAKHMAANGVVLVDIPRW